MAVNSRSRLSCISMTTLAYHSPKRVRSFGTKLKPRYIFGAGSLDQ
jgi:hypothetical protein